MTISLPSYSIKHDGRQFFVLNSGFILELVLLQVLFL